MTIRLRIENTHPDRKVQVTEVHPGEVEKKPGGGEYHIEPLASLDVYVHSSQSLRIDEE